MRNCCNAARLGRLHQPAVLNAQVVRMLRDQKSTALVENFAGQWLQFRNIDVVRPDLERFPHFDDGLRQSMRRETELFIEDIIRQRSQRSEFPQRELHVSRMSVWRASTAFPASPAPSSAAWM